MQGGCCHSANQPATGLPHSACCTSPSPPGKQKTLMLQTAPDAVIAVLPYAIPVLEERLQGEVCKRIPHNLDFPVLPADMSISAGWAVQAPQREQTEEIRLLLLHLIADIITQAGKVDRQYYILQTQPAQCTLLQPGNKQHAATIGMQQRIYAWHSCFQIAT